MAAMPSHNVPTMNIDEELLLDAQEDAQAVAYIKSHLPQELQEKYTEEELYYFLDLIYDYYATSGILDKTADKDGYIEIDAEVIADYIAQKAKKEGMGDFAAEDLLFVVEAHMDMEEDMEE